MEAVALVLTTDYDFGAVTDSGRTEQCKGDGQFEEKVCRHHVRNPAAVCGGRVMLELFYGAWPSIGDSHASYDVVFWGVGRHPINDDYTTRYGVHNASIVVEERVRPLCTDARRVWLQGTDIGRQRVFWINSHARLRPGFPDEAPEAISAYNAHMTRALSEYHCRCWQCHHPRHAQLPANNDNAQRGEIRVWGRSKHYVSMALACHAESVPACGTSAIGALCGIPTIDVHTPSAQLVQQLPGVAANMTHDGVHWSRAVNLVFAQLVLRTTLQSCAAAAAPHIPTGHMTVSKST
jgi:hypothetical protein